MILRRARRDLLLLLLLAAMPALAYAPAWTAGRLLGPGDGAALHFPLRALVWESYARGELPEWNPTIFLGTPLLAAYRPGALHPLMPALAVLPPFVAFQVLVLVSLAASAILVFLYLRRLGAERVVRSSGDSASRSDRTWSPTSRTPRPWWPRRCCPSCCWRRRNTCGSGRRRARPVSP